MLQGAGECDTTHFGELDFLIRPEEIEKCCRKLKLGKSPGLDQIPNEMIKAMLDSPLCFLSCLTFSFQCPSSLVFGELIY